MRTSAVGSRFGGLPVTRDITAAYVASLVVAALVAVVSGAGLLFGSALYGVDPKSAAGVAPSTSGVLVPGFLAQDTISIVLGLPVLLASLWLTRRGYLAGLLLWPGALYYVTYSYMLYLVGAPFNALFLLYVALVALSAFTTIGLLASVDGDTVRQRLDGAVPHRVISGILVGLAVMTFGQDASGAVITALAGGAAVDPVAHRVWIVDLAVEVPAVLIGGVLLWRQAALGYVAGAGLLLQFGMTPLGLAGTLALQPLVTGSPIDSATIAGLLVFVVVCLVPLSFFLRAATSGEGRPVAGESQAKAG